MLQLIHFICLITVSALCVTGSDENKRNLSNELETLNSVVFYTARLLNPNLCNVGKSHSHIKREDIQSYLGTVYLSTSRFQVFCW